MYPHIKEIYEMHFKNPKAEIEQRLIMAAQKMKEQATTTEPALQDEKKEWLYN